MKPFDIKNDLLEWRRLFLEASAGTGKTHVIQELALRFIFEKNISEEKILIITFTNNAAKELRERIHSRLEEISTLDSNPIAKESALENFKKLSILTIDSFFQKILKEQFLFLGVPSNFDIDDSIEYVKKSVWDEMRKRNYLLENEALLKNLNSIPLLFKSNDDFLNNLSDLLKKYLWEDFSILPNSNDQSFFLEGVKNFNEGSLAYAAYLTCLTSLHKEAKLRKDSVVLKARDILLMNEKRLKEIKSISELFIFFDEIEPSTSKSYFEYFLTLLEKSSPYQEAFLLFFRFFYSKNVLIEDGNKTCLEKQIHHRFHVAIIFDKIIPLMKDRILEDQKKGDSFSYDDVLETLYKALKKDPSLAKRFSKPYAAVFIDEFQDTSKKQWAVLKALFHHPSTYLTIVGDPKQCLYTFRNATLENYEEVKGMDDFLKQGLLDNYRSTPSMVEALNLLNAMLFEKSDISFYEAKSKKTNEVLSTLENEKPVTFYRETSKEDIFILYAKIVKNYLKLGVSPEDILILSRTNSDLDLIRKVFESNSIPIHFEKEELLFQSKESLHALELMEALCDPLNASKIKIALTSLFFSFSPNEILTLSQNENIFSLAFEAFKSAKIAFDELNLHKGMQHLESLSSVLRKSLGKVYLPYKERLINEDPSLRSLSKLEEILELFRTKQYEEGLNAEDLSLWLKNKRDRAEKEGKSARKEIDNKMVRLMTIHKSKGLEAKIVFVAYKTSSHKTKKNPYESYRENERIYLNFTKGYLDFQKRQEQKRLQEEIRILYVAMTRASMKLHLHILQDKEELFSEEKMKILLESRPALFQIEKKSDALEQETQPKKEKEALSLLKLHHPDIEKRYASVLSYSSLHPKELETTLEIDEEKDVGEDVLLDEEISILSGKNFGLLMHEILENIDFQKTGNAEIEELINDESFMEIIKKIGLSYLERDAYQKNETNLLLMLKNILNTPIQCPEGEVFTLKEIAPHEKKREIEFYFNLGPSSHLRLPLFNGMRIEKTEETHIKGFIDLLFKRKGVFYLVDWKTNHLEEESPPYSLEAMEKEYQKQSYFIQMHLYTLSLYLELRKKRDFNYEKDIGGAFYLFLKGMNPKQANSGVLHKKPSLETIQSLLSDLGVKE